MESRPLGTSSLHVSVVGMGEQTRPPGDHERVAGGHDGRCGRSTRAGITFFDTADIYGKEFGLSASDAGRGAARHAGTASSWRRSSGTPTWRRRWRAVLRWGRARTSGPRWRVARAARYRDDRPLPAAHARPVDPDRRDARGARRARDGGQGAGDRQLELLARPAAAADAAAAEHATPRFVSAQNEYNLLVRSVEDELLPAAPILGIGFLPYFPLANGLFTGKFTRTDRPADSRISRQRPQVAESAPWDAMEAYAAFCAERGISMGEATFGWFLANPALSSVIAGATRPEQVRENAASGSGWRPDADELSAIDGFFPRADRGSST